MIDWHSLTPTQKEKRRLEMIETFRPLNEWCDKQMERRARERAAWQLLHRHLKQKIKL